MIQFDLPDSNNIHQAIATYLAAEQKKPAMNTILIFLSQTRTPFQEILALLQPYLKQESTLTSSIELLYQIVKRKKDIAFTNQAETNIIEMLTDKALDLSTILYALKTILELAKRSLPQFVFKQIFNLLSNPKFHPASHRQQIRLIVYQILEIMVKYPDYIQAAKTKFITIIIESTYEERDPRNIGKMFTLYYWLLNNIQSTFLEPFKESMFSNLEAYYPIDYIGDEDEQTNTTLAELNDDLDNCLTLPIFKEQCLELLESKTATPPVLQFLPTIKKFIKNNPSEAQKLQTILQRFVQQQFLEDALCYPVIVECFCAFFQSSVSSVLSYGNYEYLIKILDLSLKVLPSKSGFVILLMKSLSGLKSTKEVSTTFIINHLIINYKLYNTDNLGYLLGLVIVIQSRIEDEHLMQLLHLSLIDIFIMEPVHIQIMILKIFMAFKEKGYKQRSTEQILKKLLSLLKSGKEDAVLRKSVLEFIHQAGDKILKFEAQEYIQEITKNIQKEAYSNIEVMVFYYLLNGIETLISLLNEQSELADTIMDEIATTLFKLAPHKIATSLISIDYQTLPLKYLKRFKQIVVQVLDNEQMSETLQHLIPSTNLQPKFKYVFSRLLKYMDAPLNTQSIDLDPTMNIRQLQPQELEALEKTLSKSTLKELCSSSSDDYPTLRQYLFQKVYPSVYKVAGDSEYEYLLFLILQKTPQSLLINSIHEIIELIMSRLETSTPEIACVSLQILNVYFERIEEEKYQRIVTVSSALLDKHNLYGMEVLCSLAEILGKMATVAGQIKYRRIVLSGLEKLVGHKKRKVRKVAAYSYNKWYYM